MRIKLYDPITEGTIFVGSVSSWKRTDEFSSTWVDADQTKIYLGADAVINSDDPLFKLSDVNGRAFMLKENDELKDFVKVTFSKTFIGDDKRKESPLVQLTPISNIEYCQLTLKKEEKPKKKKDLQRVGK